jgi:hypothetical protein
LRKIVPKRFNPRGEAWLPVLHTRRGDWHFTFLFSNTQRAHELVSPPQATLIISLVSAALI